MVVALATASVAVLAISADGSRHRLRYVLPVRVLRASQDAPHQPAAHGRPRGNERSPL